MRMRAKIVMRWGHFYPGPCTSKNFKKPTPAPDWLNHLISSPSLLKVALTDESIWNRSLNVWPREQERWIYSCWCLFFCLFFSLFLGLVLFSPIWVDKCAWCLFMESLRLMEKEKSKQGGNKKKTIGLLFFIHFMLEPVGALLHQKGLAGTRDQEKWGRKDSSCGTTSPLYPGCASSFAGGQSSPSLTRCLYLVSFLHWYVRLGCVCVVPACVTCGGPRRESFKHCHRITFQMLMTFEHREQITAGLIASGSVYHVSKCNQEMLYLYYCWFNKDRASFESNIQMRHYSRGSTAC